MLDPVKIAVVGTGYVGLVSGTCLAAKGHDVRVLDLRPEIVESINRGTPTIHEASLPEILGQVVGSGKMKACLATPEALADSEVVLLCVGTPSKDGAIDLSQIAKATELVGGWLGSITHFASVVVKSTVLPGTTDSFVLSILERTSGKKLAAGDFGLGMNPEFLREGEAIGDFNEPDRIILGHEDGKTQALLEKIYAPWNCDKLAVNSRTAEMIKYANNCLLALQISAVNELANISAARGGIDFMEVVQGVSLDKRWNPFDGKTNRANPGILSYLVPGCGFGGSCFPKDVEAMRTLAGSLGIQPRILQAVLDVNSSQPQAILAPLFSELGGDLAGKKILLLGLAFKPGTDDVRESASLKIAQHLQQAGALVYAHDPIALSNALQALGSDTFIAVNNWVDFLGTCDAVVLATRWPEYHALKNHQAVLHQKPILDCRRFLHAADFPESKFLTVGKTPKKPAEQAL